MPAEPTSVSRRLATSSSAAAAAIAAAGPESGVPGEEVPGCPDGPPAARQDACCGTLIAGLEPAQRGLHHRAAPASAITSRPTGAWRPALRFRVPSSPPAPRADGLRELRAGAALLLPLSGAERNRRCGRGGLTSSACPTGVANPHTAPASLSCGHQQRVASPGPSSPTRPDLADRRRATRLEVGEEILRPAGELKGAAEDESHHGEHDPRAARRGRNACCTWRRAGWCATSPTPPTALIRDGVLRPGARRRCFRPSLPSSPPGETAMPSFDATLLRFRDGPWNRGRRRRRVPVRLLLAVVFHKLLFHPAVHGQDPAPHIPSSAPRFTMLATMALCFMVTIIWSFLRPTRTR